MLQRCASAPAPRQARGDHADSIWRPRRLLQSATRPSSPPGWELSWPGHLCPPPAIPSSRRRCRHTAPPRARPGNWDGAPVCAAERRGRVRASRNRGRQPADGCRASALGTDRSTAAGRRVGGRARRRVTPTPGTLAPEATALPERSKDFAPRLHTLVFARDLSQLFGQ